jgi:hypothetical protein
MAKRQQSRVAAHGPSVGLTGHSTAVRYDSSRRPCSRLERRPGRPSRTRGRSGVGSRSVLFEMTGSMMPQDAPLILHSAPGPLRAERKRRRQRLAARRAGRRAFRSGRGRTGRRARAPAATAGLSPPGSRRGRRRASGRSASLPAGHGRGRPAKWSTGEVSPPGQLQASPKPGSASADGWEASDRAHLASRSRAAYPWDRMRHRR